MKPMLNPLACFTGDTLMGTLLAVKLKSMGLVEVLWYILVPLTKLPTVMAGGV